MIIRRNTLRRRIHSGCTLTLATLFIGVALSISACDAKPNEQDVFMDQLTKLCGNAYSAKVVSTDARDSVWRSSAIIVGPVNCERSSIIFPLSIGDNRAQSWVIQAKSGGLSFKHVHKQHAHSDGSVDPINNYGGQTQSMGSALRQDFPADTFSRKLFREQGLPASATNVWALDIKPGEALGYEMSRPQTLAQLKAGEAARYFRMEVDISAPLPAATAILEDTIDQE